MNEQVLMKILVGAVGGIGTAAAVDFQAFRTWTTFDQVYTYAWRTALFRWLQGAIIGGVAAFGLGQ